MGKKIFVGRLPQEANVEDLCHYFGRFGQISDVYVPKVLDVMELKLFLLIEHKYKLNKCYLD